LQDVRGNTIQSITCQDQSAKLCSSVYLSYFPDATTRTLTPNPKNDLLLTEDLFDKRLVNDRLRISATAERDWNALADHERDSIRAALELLDEDPIAGAPLFEPLRGVWSHRVEHLRVIYRILPEARFIVILSIARAAEQP